MISNFTIQLPGRNWERTASSWTELSRAWTELSRALSLRTKKPYFRLLFFSRCGGCVTGRSAAQRGCSSGSITERSLHRRRGKREVLATGKSGGLKPRLQLTITTYHHIKHAPATSHKNQVNSLYILPKRELMIKLHIKFCTRGRRALGGT